MEPFGVPLALSLLAMMIASSGVPGSWSVNDEGMALLAFRDNIKFDPLVALENWSPNDGDPCQWTGVHCVDNKVQMLNLTDLSLEGTLAPDVGKLSHLKYLVLYKNRLIGEIPKEIGGLARLEHLDLRDNDLSRMIPVEIGRMRSLKQLFLGDNRFEGGIHLPIKSLSLLSDLVIVSDHVASTRFTGFGSINRKFGHCTWPSNFKHWNNAKTLTSMLKGTLTHYLNYLQMPSPSSIQDSLDVHGDTCCDNLSNSFESHMILARLRLLDQPSLNLPALPFAGPEPSIQIIALPTGRSSGVFPAVPDPKEKLSPPPVPEPMDSPPSTPSPIAKRKLNNKVPQNQVAIYGSIL